MIDKENPSDKLEREEHMTLTADEAANELLGMDKDQTEDADLDTMIRDSKSAWSSRDTINE